LTDYIGICDSNRAMSKAMEPTVRPLFTPADAERLVGVPRATTKRWLEGYAYEYKGQIRRSGPRLGPHSARIDDVLLMSFLDLIEVRMARQLRALGLPWRLLDRVAAWFRSAWNSEHPFALQRLRTDGRTAFAEIGGHLKEARLVEIGTDQYVFDEIVSASLFDVLDFRDDGVPFRFWPRGRDGLVVVDPGRAFGQPVLDTSGVPVSVIAAAYAANDNDAERVAADFEVPLPEVEAALRFVAGSRLAA
jgi:uncharacterized protein (DUF433 family)